jgi:hypothetical protein
MAFSPIKKNQFRLGPGQLAQAADIRVSEGQATLVGGGSPILAGLKPAYKLQTGIRFLMLSQTLPRLEKY